MCDIELGKLTFIDEILRQEYTWFCQGKNKGQWPEQMRVKVVQDEKSGADNKDLKRHFGFYCEWWREPLEDF